MFLHSHVYLSNQVEPGSLFPNVIQVDYTYNFGVDQSGRILEPKSAIEIGNNFSLILNPAIVTESDNFNFVSTELNPIFAFVPLYYSVPGADDFSLAEMMTAFTGIITFDISSHTLIAEDQFEFKALDFVPTLVGSDSQEYVTEPMTMKYIYAPDVSIEVTATPMADVNLVSAGTTTVTFTLS